MLQERLFSTADIEAVVGKAAARNALRRGGMRAAIDRPARKGRPRTVLTVGELFTIFLALALKEEAGVPEHLAGRLAREAGDLLARAIRGSEIHFRRDGDAWRPGRGDLPGVKIAVDLATLFGEMLDRLAAANPGRIAQIEATRAAFAEARQVHELARTDLDVKEALAALQAQLARASDGDLLAIANRQTKVDDPELPQLAALELRVRAVRAASTERLQAIVAGHLPTTPAAVAAARAELARRAR